MSNFNHANDKLKVPLCNLNNDGNQFSKKTHYLKNILRLLELSFEGFYFSNNYASADVKESYQMEGKSQCIFYLQIFDEAMLSLDSLFHEMRSNFDESMEGK